LTPRTTPFLFVSLPPLAFFPPLFLSKQAAQKNASHTWRRQTFGDKDR
jgi:hypothetical protein